MKPKFCFQSIVCFLRWIALLIAAPLFAVSAVALDVHLKLLPSGAVAMTGGYSPQHIVLSTAVPKSVKKLPTDLVAPLFGTLKIGEGKSATAFSVVLDEPEGIPARLFVDTNANGDLTDDPPTTWASRPLKGNDGAEYAHFSGSAKVNVLLGREPATVSLGMYRFDKHDPRGAQDRLYYYADYAREGEVTLGGKAYKALLTARTTIDYRGTQATVSSATLFIDVNQNGRFDRASEAFDAGKPFNVGGQTYEILGLTADGESFRIEKSKKVVAVKKSSPSKIPSDQQVDQPGMPREYSLKGSYGTLAYEGTVRRHEIDDDFRFEIVMLQLTFVPNATVNRVPQVDAKVIRFSATARPESGKGRWTVIFEDRKPLGKILTVDSPTATFNEIEFVIPKAIVKEADSVGFSITDDRTLWPLSGEMK